MLFAMASTKYEMCEIPPMFDLSEDTVPVQKVWFEMQKKTQRKIDEGQQLITFKLENKIFSNIYFKEERDDERAAGYFRYRPIFPRGPEGYPAEPHVLIRKVISLITKVSVTYKPTRLIPHVPGFVRFDLKSAFSGRLMFSMRRALIKRARSTTIGDVRKMAITKWVRDGVISRQTKVAIMRPGASHALHNSTVLWNYTKHFLANQETIERYCVAGPRWSTHADIK